MEHQKYIWIIIIVFDYLSSSRMEGHWVTSFSTETNMNPTRILLDIATVLSFNVSGKGSSVDYWDKEENGPAHLGTVSGFIPVK